MAFNPGSRPGPITLSELRKPGGPLSGLLRLSELLDSKPDCTVDISRDSAPTLLLRLVSPCMSAVALSMSTLHPTRLHGWALSGKHGGEPGVGDLVLVTRFTSRPERCELCEWHRSQSYAKLNS
jgi:hypothetical protein